MTLALPRRDGRATRGQRGVDPVPDHYGTPQTLRIGRNHRRGQGEFAGDKSQHSREQCQELLVRKVTREP